MGAFVGIVLGCSLIAWSVYYVGRMIARVLWGILCVVEKEDQQRKIYEAQKQEIFGERDHVNKPTLLDKLSNFQYRRMRDTPPWQV